MAKLKVGVRKTNQREIIYEVIKNSKGPLSPNELLEKAKENNESIGIATIYRTIKLLIDANEIIQVTLPDGQTRYELSKLDHHHHFKCKKCNSIFDLDNCPLSIPDQINVPAGFILEGHEITLFGVCAKCSKTNASTT
ncbi:MAG: transcriptional repressor [Planctomycetota bacterium]|nr:MAG: transcriptional repressor [Planctomycetota bacterium]